MLNNYNEQQLASFLLEYANKFKQYDSFFQELSNKNKSAIIFNFNAKELV